MRILLQLAVLPFLILSGCASTSLPDAKPAVPVQISGDFAGSPDAQRFVQRMAQQHGFKPTETAAIISRAQRQQSIINLMNQQAPSKSTGPTGAWTRYRGKFLTDDTINNGVAFWQRNQAAFDRAESTYGVPAEYVAAIIGVETRYGGFTGKTRIIDALTTLSFAYPRRAEYFTNELAQFLIMTRDEGVDPFQPRGSFAGAMGLGQFMPSSFHKYAVDFTGDGHRDLWDPADAIGSVANYFKGHGWQTGQPAATRARLQPSSSAAQLKSGFDTRYSISELAAKGIEPIGSLGNARQVSLLQLDAKGGYEYWLGLPNFYVITRYNHSTYYAMAVYQLAQAIRARKLGR